MTPDLAAVLGLISFFWFWSALFNGKVGTAAFMFLVTAMAEAYFAIAR
jgi:hypothetical protein